MVWMGLLTASSKFEKYHLSVCALFKNEEKHLKEWIEYHRLIGVDHFYLYNNNSSDCPIRVLKPYIDDGIVTLINWPDCIHLSSSKKRDFIWSLAVQQPAYQHAAKCAALHETKWLTFLDVSEFLIPVGHHNLIHLLEKYKDAPGVILSRKYFDASPINVFPKYKLVIESLDITSRPEKNLHREVEKLIFKPKECKAFSWAPFNCYFKNARVATKISGSEIRINRYLNRNQKYYDPRFAKKRAIPSGLNYDKETKFLLEQGYTVEDQEREIFDFIPALQKTLGYYTETN